ncbi:site-specific integrase [Variovorax sp. J2P1-59]|uniref:site-specific integrase n=1 Tax=Variovorax flavidus TaxID=3053501 RepID=UPI002578ABD7|nr:site-specific integrase [Variovorax sp. J2P1-59]MDM0076873.1 site-specific integrase [Variovorax sp. J2P1-59]
MARNAYLTLHHGTWWFQIRVPQSHQAALGQQRIRVNLQTDDVALARPFALRLASEWLLRFASAPGLPGLPSTSLAIALPSRELASAITTPARNLGAVQLPVEVKAAPASHALCADMLALFRYWRGLNTERAPSSVKEFESTARKFKAVIAKAPHELVRTDITQFRDHLLQVGDARATVTKKLSFVNAMLQSAYDAGYLPANVARGMKVPRPKVETVKRMAFSVESLTRIFTSKVYNDGFRPQGGGGEALAWVPMLALVTGARLEELCQLRLADVLHDQALGWYLRIDDGEGQRVKTTSSRRLVPLHLDIVDSGFVRYVQGLQAAGHEWVFPVLEPDNDGRRGGNFGKVFARLLRSPTGCGVDDRRLVFHSFRHTFKTMCRASGISEEVHDALSGHVGHTVGRDYGSVPLGRLFDAVRSIKVPIGLPKVA